MKGKSLQFKLMLSGIAIVLIPLLFVGTFTAWKTTGAIESMANGQSMLVARQLSDMMQLDIQEKLAIIRTTGSVISSSAHDPDAVNKILEGIHKTLGNDCELMVFMNSAR